MWTKISSVKYYLQLVSFKCSRLSSDSSVGTATGYGQDDRGSRVRFPAQAGNCSLHHRVQTGSGAHPASYPIGTGGDLCLEVKRAECEADHSPPSNAEVENAWSYTSTPPVCLHCVVLSSAHGQLYLYLYHLQQVIKRYLSTGVVYCTQPCFVFWCYSFQSSKYATATGKTFVWFTKYFRVVKSRRITWTEHVARIGEMRNALRNSGRKTLREETSCKT
jgi:hypothetical protein